MHIKRLREQQEQHRLEQEREQHRLEQEREQHRLEQERLEPEPWRRLDGIEHIIKANVTGVIQIGASNGGEARLFSSLIGSNMVWIEAQPLVAEELRRNVTQYGQKAIQALIWEKSGETKTFNITNNSVSSSILEPYLHIDHFGDQVRVRDRIQLVTTSYTDLVKKYPYLLDKKYNFIVLDCQGAEYEVLLGIGKEHIQQFDLVEVEVSNSEEYKGQKQQPAIDKLLADWGFGPQVIRGMFMV